ncbi:hypothetical protein BX661DRAFT_180561, partial [Kickxella alabastrina]|uniref:uncharacterized protein n=1 Tax=Kickxella alabastrina TaxID=61397 RepID=UPI00221F7A45
ANLYLDYADEWVHSVFDPMHLSGIGNYWRVTAVALIVHWLIISHFNSPGLMKSDGRVRHAFRAFLPWVLGYYIWDMSYGFTYLIHAFLGVFGILVLTSRQLQFYAIPFLLPELSDSLVYKANFVLFLITYVGIRIGYEMYQSFGWRLQFIAAKSAMCIIRLQFTLQCLGLPDGA